MAERPGVVVVRPLAASDASATRALFTAAFGNTLYAEAPRDALHRALTSARDGQESSERRGLIAESDGRTVGVAIYGEVAGTRGAGKMHGMAVVTAAQRHGIARTLIEALAADLTQLGARFVLVEFPDAPELAAGRTLLLQSKFVEMARVPDFFLDGVALSFLRRELRLAASA